MGFYIKKIPLVFVIDKPDEIDSSLADKINNISVQIMDVNFIISSIKKIVDYSIPDSAEVKIKEKIQEVKGLASKKIAELKDNKIFKKITNKKEITNKENLAKKESVLSDNKKLILKDKIILPLLVNPYLLEINKTPKVNTTLTKRGLVAQYWPAEPDSLTMRGDSANPKAFALLSQFDYLIRTSETGTRNPVYMIYKFGLGAYRGYFKNFKISLDGNKAGWFAYQFDFTFLDFNHFRYFLYSITPDFANQIISSPISSIKDQVQIGAREFLRGIPLGYK